MVNTAESKQDKSRHFGLKPKARSSATSIGKGPKRAPVAKKLLVVPSRHISRKDQFYGLQTPRNTQHLFSLKKKAQSSKATYIGSALQRSTVYTINKNSQEMHPEQVQIAAAVEGLGEEKIIKPQEVAEDEIDVEEVDNGDQNGGANEELNGNGFLHKKNGNGHSQVEFEKHEIFAEEKVQSDLNGAEVKSVTRIRGSRRNSTSSRSSSVSSARSVKQQIPMALQMEVSMDEEDRDHMEPLIIEGTAEDLEVSMSASHDDADDGATTDSDAFIEPPHDPYEFEDDLNIIGDQQFEEEIFSKKARGPKSSKGGKAVKLSAQSKVESKAVKPKTPRTKSLKLKGSKPSPKLSDKIFDDADTENSDTNSMYKDDTESEDLNTKPSKSPSKRMKSTPSKLDTVDEADVDEKSGEAEHVPRRSSRSRQTPQKYNSSLYADSVWEHQLLGDDRMNNSDAVGASIRSVKGRRSLRKSRNISALNTSLHNESSPWDNEFKVLTPSGGGVSAHDVPAGDKMESSTPLKRKASDEDDDELNERGQKKMCVENTDLNNSTSSHTSSFFSVITSPIVMLKNKFRGSSVSSTPIKDASVPQTEEPKLPADTEIKNDDDIVSSVANETATSAPVAVETPTVEQAQEARSWCTIM